MNDTARIHLKVCKRDKAALQRLARAEGEAMSVVLRRFIRQGLRERQALQSTTEIMSRTELEKDKQENE